MTIASVPTRLDSGIKNHFHDGGRPTPQKTQQHLNLSFTPLNQTMMPLFTSHTACVQDSLTERIQTFVMGNLGNRITLKELARFLGYSEKYSSEFFQLQMGTCFSHYLKRLRIMKAKHMLVGDEVSVNHVAEALGFSDSFAFSHFFKRAMGCSPTAFRKQQSNYAGRK